MNLNDQSELNLGQPRQSEPSQDLVCSEETFNMRKSPFYQKQIEKHKTYSVKKDLQSSKKEKE